VCVMSLEAIKYNLFIESACIIVFLHSYLKTRTMHLVSQRVMAKIKLILHNTFSECLIVNVTDKFHILIHKRGCLFDLLLHGGSPSTRFVHHFETFTMLEAIQSTGNE
jgi:hypothetical protein